MEEVLMDLSKEDLIYIIKSIQEVNKVEISFNINQKVDVEEFDVIDYYESKFDEVVLNKTEVRWMNRWLKEYGYDNLIEAIDIAINFYCKPNVSDTINSDQSFSRIGGILYNIHKKNNPK
jgi:hypothetical protein